MIDLGLLPAADAEREPPAPARPAGRHWTPHHSYWAAALAALLLLLTGASAAQPPPWPVPHFTLAARALTGGIFLTEDILLVAEQSSDRLLDFTAYRLADGAALWQAHGTDGYVWQGVPVLWRDGRDRTFQTNVLDLATGRVVWQGDGGLAATTADRLVLVRDPTQQAPGDADEVRWPPLLLEVVDRATGEVVLRLDQVRQWAVSEPPAGPATLITAAAGRPVTSYDLATGEPLAASPAVELGPDGALTAAGDVLLVQPREAEPDYVAYDARTLTPRWRGDPRTQIWSIESCGPVLCTFDGRLAAVDPATGEPVWSARRFSDERFVAYQPGPPWPPGYLLVEPRDRFLVPELPMALVRAATGEVVAEYPGWTLPTSMVSRRDRAGQARHAGPMLQRYEGPRNARQRPEGTPVPPGHTWFARLHFDPVRLEVLGAVEGGLYGCQAAGDYIACPEVETVRVWRTR